MGKKRKSVASRLDEVDRTMYSTFSAAASSLSQLYTQAMNQHKVSFQAGERHGLEKLYQWIMTKHGQGCSLTPAEIIDFIDNEFEYGGEDEPISLRMQQQHPQHAVNSINLGIQTSALLLGGKAIVGHGNWSAHHDQTKNPVFSNALLVPVHRNLHHCQLGQGRGFGQQNTSPAGNVARNLGANSSSLDPYISLSSNDSSMDIHWDSPDPEYQ